MFDNHHGVIPKSENWTQELLPLYRAIEAHISITEGAGLNLCYTHPVHLLKECTESGVQTCEVVLVDWRLQLHDRQVFIVQAVAASHVHLMSERRTGHRVLQGEAAGHVWARIDGPVRHRSDDFVVLHYWGAKWWTVKQGRNSRERQHRQNK